MSVNVIVADFGAEGDKPRVTQFREDQVDEIVEFTKMDREIIENAIAKAKTRPIQEVVFGINLQAPFREPTSEDHIEL